VARQDLGQKNGKGLAATAALAAIRTKDPLTALGLAGGLSRIVAVKFAVAVQAFSAAAVRAPLLLEGKSSAANSLAAATNRNLDFSTRACCAIWLPRSSFFLRHDRRRDSVD